MDIIYFRIDGNPKGKDRPRFARGHTYTPKPTKDYEKKVVKTFKSEYPHYEVPTGALEVDIDVYYKPIKSISKSDRAKMLSGEIRPTKKPDADNIAKIILDALNGYAYEDDKQVVELTVKKYYAEVAHTDVYIGNL